jgi:hypothetical protein
MELVSRAAVDRALGFLALALPVVGLLVGSVLGRIRPGRTSGSAGRGFAVGLVGPLIWVLWRVTNAVQGRLGLDSVAALLINFGIFIVVGLAIGVVIGKALGDR